MLRNETEFERAVNYVLDNAIKAKLNNWEWIWVRGQGARATAGEGAGATVELRSERSTPEDEQS
jgi:hypothetical protein